MYTTIAKIPICQALSRRKIWLLAPFPSPVSKLERRHTGRLRKKDRLLTGGEGSLIIRLQESLVIYKSFNTLRITPIGEEDLKAFPLFGEVTCF
jgi:hypothetical protein